MATIPDDLSGLYDGGHIQCVVISYGDGHRDAPTGSAMLVDARDLHLNAFKVVTERGTTYLMGRVTQREADRATQVVRATPGVQKVIRVFEIISEEELASMRPAPAKPQPVTDKPAGS